jgi:short-subunit dehydrogenase
MDLSTVAACRELAEEIQRREGKLDILVNNAGAAWGAEFGEFPEQGWDKVMTLNVKSPFFLSQALHPALKAAASAERPAKVINIASIDGIKLNPLETYSYHASKAALIYLTRRMAAKLVEDRIVVSAIAPGPFASDMNRMARDQGDVLAARVPMRRIGRDDDMAARRSTSHRALATTSSATPSQSTGESRTRRCTSGRSEREGALHDASRGNPVRQAGEPAPGLGLPRFTATRPRTEPGCALCGPIRVLVPAPGRRLASRSCKRSGSFSDRAASGFQSSSRCSRSGAELPLQAAPHNLAPKCSPSSPFRGTRRACRRRAQRATGGLAVAGRFEVCTAFHGYLVSLPRVRLE